MNLQQMVGGSDGVFDAIFHHSIQRWLEYDEVDAVLWREGETNPPFNITVQLFGPGPPLLEGLFLYAEQPKFADNYHWTPMNQAKQLNCTSIPFGPDIGCTVARVDPHDGE